MGGYSKDGGIAMRGRSSNDAKSLSENILNRRNHL